MKDQVVAATAKFAVFVEPDTITAFNANADVTAYEEVPANCDDTELVYVLNAVVSSFPVPTGWPFKLKEPVMFTEPVKL